MTAPLNPEPLFQAQHEAGVQHIIIGGFAVTAHGAIRPTRNLDIVPDPDPPNLERPRRVCGLGHLIAMKRAAGRPRDLDDLKRLGVG